MSDDRVLDASALLLALIGRDEAAGALRARLPGMRLHAPHLIDAEVGNVLRRHERHGRISPLEAETALRMGQSLVGRRYPHTGILAELAWERRANVTFYDALYAALAVQLDVPLITADVRLARAPSLGCRVEVA